MAFASVESAQFSEGTACPENQTNIATRGQRLFTQEVLYQKTKKNQENSGPPDVLGMAPSLGE